MQIWSKIHIKDKNKDIDIISKSLTNYIHSYGPIEDIYKKYNIKDEDKFILNSYVSNRIAGLLMLYFAKDTKRINDIVNKYNINNNTIGEIIPEIEGYVEKKIEY